MPLGSAGEDANKALRSSEARLRLALESANMMAWEWNLDTGEVKRSGKFAEIFSCSEVAETGRDTDLLDLIHPHDKAYVLAAHQAARLSAASYSCEYRLLLPNGEVRWVADRGRAERDSESRYMYGVLMDVTSPKRAEEELRVAQRTLYEHDLLLGRMLDGFPNGSVNVFDRDFRYVVAAGGGLRQVGLTSEMLVGKTLHELFPPEAVRFVRPHYERAFAGESVQFELAQGSETYLIDCGPLIEEGKTVTRIIAVAQNVTQQKKTEEVLLSQAEELARSNADLQQFALAASHDLQEPLRTITGYTQLLTNRYGSQLDDEGSELLEHIALGAWRMRELISALLDYSRAASTETAAFNPVNMNATLDWAKMNLSAVIADSNATIESEPLPVVPGDQVLLVQLLQNLIANAIKYRGKDKPSVFIDSRVQDNEIVFAVKDNGSGIEPEYLVSIFGVFKRLHGREVPGAGIGLAICKRIVEKHGGRLWAESDGLGQGATFRFTIRNS